MIDTNKLEENKTRNGEAVGKPTEIDIDNHKIDERDGIQVQQSRNGMYAKYSVNQQVPETGY